MVYGRVIYVHIQNMESELDGMQDDIETDARFKRDVSTQSNENKTSLLRPINLAVAVGSSTILIILLLYFYVFPALFKFFRKYCSTLAPRQAYHSCANDPIPSNHHAVTSPPAPVTKNESVKRTPHRENRLVLTIQRELVGKYEGVVISPLIVNAPGPPKLKPVRPAPPIPVFSVRSRKNGADNHDDSEGRRYENVMPYELLQPVTSSDFSKPKCKAPPPPPPSPVVGYSSSMEGNNVKNIAEIFASRV